MSQQPEQVVPTLEEFDRLIDGLITGQSRSRFVSWEIELLLDIAETHSAAPGEPDQLLRRYQAAVHLEWESGVTQPMKLSEYLSRERKIAGMRAQARHREKLRARKPA